MKTLKDCFNPKWNSLGFIRFVAAILVIFTHCFPLGDFDSRLLTVINKSPGAIAVEIFFILSGFLVTGSYLRASSVIRYGWHRFLRIYPGLWMCLTLTALVIAPLAFFYTGYGTFADYFSADKHHAFSYLFSNLFSPRRQLGIANVFEYNPHPKDLNGSLWTLWLEAKLYVLVAGLGILGLLSKRKRVLLTIFSSVFAIYSVQLAIPAARMWLSSIQYLAAYAPDGTDIWGEQRLILYFMAGVLLLLYQHKININSTPIAVGMFTATLLGFTVLPHDLVCIISLPYLVFWLAINLPFQRFEKQLKGDYSYGLYIYGYPIQQTLSAFELNHYGFGLYFLLSILCTFPIALASWHWIEKPCLNLKHLSLPFLSRKAKS